MDRLRWLHEQIARWTEDGVITAGQAEELRARHPLQVSGGWGRMIFAALGALIFGLGVILLIAYNWAEMHRYAKLALIGSALLAAHGAGYRLGLSPARRRLAESLHLLGTMLFGAGIWLVAQIYHIDAHYPNGFFVWSLGALALAWALPSTAQGLLAAGLLLLWSWFEAVHFPATLHGAPWLVAAGLLPLAWWQRSRVLLALGVLLFLFEYSLVVLRLDNDFVWPLLWLLSAAVLGAAEAARGRAFAAGSATLQWLGRTGLVLFLFAGSFSSVAESLHAEPARGWLEWLYVGLPVLLFVAAWSVAGMRGRFGGSDADARIETAVMLAVTLLVLAALLGVDVGVGLWIGCNLALLAAGGMRIRAGIRRQQPAQVTLGCAILSALVVARFMDLFDSLLLRAAVFLLLGALLFVVGLLYSRHGRAEPADA